MTGGRGERRGPAGRRDFGSSGPPRARTEGERPAYDPFEGAELEDVSIGRTVRTASPRVGASGIIAVLAIALLLAGGFGLMGGHGRATPKPTQVAVGPSPVIESTSTPGPPTAPPIVTEVSPWTPCTAPSDEPPEIRLELGPITYRGHVEILASDSGVIPSTYGGTPPVTVPPFTSPDLWIVGARCAVGWRIEIVDHDVLDAYTNARRDPRVASQNRFDLYLAQYGGLRGAELQATLVFPSFTARATWQLDIEPWPRPAVFLRSGKAEQAMRPGCDVESQIPDLSVDDGRCDAEVDALPDRALRVLPSDPLLIDTPDWNYVSDYGVECGELVDGYFEGNGSCDQTPGRVGSTLTFNAPDVAGGQVIRTYFCAVPRSAPEPIPVCFSWFGLIDVRPGQ